MKFDQLLDEGYSRGRPVVCVDVQPSYLPQANPDNVDYVNKVARFLAGQRGTIMMYVNADETGMTEDNVEHDIYPFWEEAFAANGLDFYDTAFNQMEWFDKGYGYLRGWMDYHIADRIIVQVIRKMYQQKVSDSRELWGGDEDVLIDYVKHICGGGGRIHSMCPTIQPLRTEPIQVGWVAVNQLKRYNNCYLIGGGRNECLKEVSLLMNAFNIKYTVIDELVYG